MINRSIVKLVVGICWPFLFSSITFTQNPPLQIIVIGAHPDDCDIDAGGTAALWASMGHNVKFLSLTNGDAGEPKPGNRPAG